MKIAVVGIGYVGLVTGACFAELGAEVHCVDVDEKKIAALKQGIMPIYEARIEAIVKRTSEAGRLHFSTKLEEVIPKVEIIFIAVGTPSDEDGSADIKYVLDVARSIGRSIMEYRLVVIKSTVPVGTSRLVEIAIKEELEKRGLGDLAFDVASNPEFLKEGNAVEDFMKPDRVVVGVESERAKDLMTQLYKPMLLNNFRVLFMDIASAEMTKYAANAMLATRISFMNDIANLSELVGADVNEVRRGIGSDERIGSKFLYPGCGYGGSCFPKDVKALIDTGRQHGYRLGVLEAVEAVNERQKHVLFRKFSSYYEGEITGMRVAVWGLSFKPGTNDLREASSLTLIRTLLEAGCKVTVYDPVAMPEARHLLGNTVDYAADMYEAVHGADALFHVTEWKEFRMLNWSELKRLMKTPLVIDGRNVYEPGSEEGIIYRGIGLPPIN